jgi:hypothetical protein
LIYVEDGSAPKTGVPSAPDHVIVEDCSDRDDFEDDEVDYSIF